MKIRKLIALLATLLMLASVVPVSAFAEMGGDFPWTEPSEKMLIEEILERDGFIDGIWLPWFNSGQTGHNLTGNDLMATYYNSSSAKDWNRVELDYIGADKIGGPSRGDILRLEDGTLLCGGMTPSGECGAYIFRSENGGDDWSRSEVIALPERYKNNARPDSTGLWSPSIWSEGGQYVHAVMRSSAGYVFRADSVDGGRTWCTPYPLNVANSNSPLCALSLPDLRVLLLCNPASIPEGKERGKRSPLVLYESTTGGSTFKRSTVLATGYGEFAYPSMKHEDGKLYITFTKNKTEIVLVIIEL